MSSILNLDELLGQALDTVEAAPDFCDPDTGEYAMTLLHLKTVERKAKDQAKAQAEGKPTEWFGLRLTYTIDDTISIENGKQPVKPGSLYSEEFRYTAEQLPYFKSRIAELVLASGGTTEDADALTIGDCVAGMANIPFHVSVKTTHEKAMDGSGREYARVRFSNLRAAE